MFINFVYPTYRLYTCIYASNHIFFLKPVGYAAGLIGTVVTICRIFFSLFAISLHIYVNHIIVFIYL